MGKRESWRDVEATWDKWYFSHPDQAARWFVACPRDGMAFFRRHPRAARIGARVLARMGGAA